MKIFPRSFCIVRISSLGDVLLVSPLLRQLRSKYPAARIDAVTGKRYADVLRYNPHITSIIEMETSGGLRGILRAKSEARQKLTGRVPKYDVLVDLQRNLRSGIFRADMARSVEKIHKYRLRKIALVRWKRGVGQPVIPVPLRYTLTALRYGVTDDGGGLELWLPEEGHLAEYPPEKRAQDLLKVTGRKVVGGLSRRIAFAPGARHFTKRWPPERFAALGMILRKRFDAEITLLGGAEDAALCAEIAALLPFPIQNLAGAADVFGAARALDRCDLAVTNDSAAMHIAAARRVPIVAIFGSTVRELGFAPFRTEFEIAEVSVSCRPCSHIGRGSCPEGHFRCMLEISPEAVAELVGGLLGGCSGI